MKRIVLTGGPCAGKTTAFNYVPEKLANHGVSVICVPEAATLLINSGVSPLTLKAQSKKKYLAFEELLIRTQILLEEKIFAELARIKNGKKKLILLDRGCMDAAAYLEPKEFRKILKRNYWDVVGLRDKRYDAVFHLLTVADGRPDLYTQNNNTARLEKTPEQAIEADQRTQHVWLGHSYLAVINNSTLFQGKMRRLLKAIQRILGIPASLEIERKFLMQESFNLSDIPVPHQTVQIEQGYLKTSGPQSRIRRRSQEGHSIYFRTFKLPTISPMVREEKEKRITSAEYRELLERQDPDTELISKERICFLWKNQYFELDVFKAPKRLAGLMLLEIELTEKNDRVKIPDWLGKVKEVTADPNYKNRTLAKRL